ncbi:BON domain-containing protein [Caulobacter sp. NIBR2454]|uniref:BON domain-containing protein n=1 Tax=Caulobacter sp. NIBR2454 TaxID=3015996 RepID=UPI0022B6DE13|nr:BON domain-containing protein [Caulobacter sp. NIBR2454]
MKNDKTLRLKIIKALDGERLLPSERIGVAVEHGLVSLFGHVANERERQLALQIVSRQRDVVSVLDALEAAAPRPAPSSLYDHDKTYEAPFEPLHLDIDEAVTRYETRGPIERPQEAPESWFEAFAESLVLPVFNDVIASARRAGHDGQVLHRKERDAHIYRLELTRADHPDDQPAPWLELAPADRGHKVAVTRGGTYPGPADHNFFDTEVSWEEVEPKAVHQQILKWVKRVFRNYRD